MEQERKTQTVYFKDLFFAICYQWKWLIIAVLVGAILLGGIQILGSNKAASVDSVSITPERQLKVEHLQATQERLEYNIEAQTTYLENSVLMSIDPYASYSAGVYLCVTPEAPENTEQYDHQVAALLRGYYTCLFSPEALESMGTQFQMEASYLRELLSFDFSNVSYLNISARGRDQAEAEALRQAMVDIIHQNHENVSQSVGAHTVTVIPFTVGPKIDTSLFDTQNSAYQKLTTMKNNLIATIDELDRLLPTALQSGGMSPLLFAVIGAFLGFCLVAGIAFVGHLASGKIYSARVLQDRTQLKILGCLPGKERNAIDRWLRKLEGRATKDSAEAVATNICNRTKDCSDILLLGSYEDAYLQPLVKALESRGKICTVCADPAHSAPAMQAIDSCQSAVLVETCGVSGYESAIWAKDTIAEYGKNILGCVVIDG